MLSPSDKVDVIAYLTSAFSILNYFGKFHLTYQISFRGMYTDSIVVIEPGLYTMEALTEQ